ncbi:Zn-ribbon domain-containing OB-fold protein [Parapusillimonas granuli]|uniref:Zn-ribbon domain-containing OB-fold protein n=1 Tax=Parapusillimonas granuli TaxID=380911 RepID=A0A853G5A8_9BURK|nr:Zn-ribbon domain-containing OB-fold protein [Parapusillimonas granuli]MBB5215567.1 hypothetical protein [Parapusillimonas granuli]MEB2401078.1 Zn-ribbon domain-containing OB-fold protein [Alcaligenaceae bacterium]NYT49766.1 Zn-ribbon domain-containing OB-fold protein [Parapusillimonas granuli]
MSGHQITAKPQPRVNEVSEPFWTGVNEGRIRLQRCLNESCGRVIFYPRVCCPFCHGSELEWTDAAGDGKVISHTTIHRAHHDGFNGELPYVFAAVELAEGVIFYGQLRGAPTDGTSLVGSKVRAEFSEHGPDRKIVVFRPA